MKPKLVYKSRPKKSGAKKRQRALSHKKRLIAAGVDEKAIAKLPPSQIRAMLNKVVMGLARKKRSKKAKPARKG